MKRAGPLRRRSRIKPVSDKRLAGWGDGQVGGATEERSARDASAGEVRITGRVVDGSGTVLGYTPTWPSRGQPKVGGLLSATLRAYARGHARCRFCPEPAIELHHTPPRGVLGYTCDLLAIPCCRPCHDACHAGRILADRQAAEVARWWRYLISTDPGVARVALVELAAVEIR